MPHSTIQPATVIFSHKPTLTPWWILLSWIRNLLILTGLLTITTIGFLYFYGQQTVRLFDDKFINSLSQFVEEVLKGDVPNAVVIKIVVEKEVTIQQIIQSMTKYAERLQVKFIKNYSLPLTSQSVAAKISQSVEIFEFDDDSVVAALLDYNPNFAIYFPCRIILYKDKEGQTWLATINLTLLVYGSQEMSPKTKLQALTLQDKLLKIMGAGASGWSDN